MLNYQSVRSSEPQIRSNPALKQLGSKSKFQEVLRGILEVTPVPFPTFQLVKETSKSFLESQQLVAWIRPSHLRSTWLILADGLPALLYDPKHPERLSALRISYNTHQIQQKGPLCFEVAWDAQDHILWVFDVAIWEKQCIWGTMPYSKRWSILQTSFQTLFDHGHPMSDAELKLPTWISLQMLASYESIDPAMSIEFQPERAGQRRQLLLLKDEGVRFKPTSHHERKMVSEARIATGSSNSKRVILKESKECAIVVEEEVPQAKIPSSVHISTNAEQTHPIVPEQGSIVCKLSKDTTRRGPDTYKLESMDGTSFGLASIRSLVLSMALREALLKAPILHVQVQWYEPFQKYEVKQIL